MAGKDFLDLNAVPESACDMIQCKGSENCEGPRPINGYVPSLKGPGSL